MPVADTKPSWADQVELGEESELPLPTEKIENGVKTITEWKYNDDNKKVKVIRQYKIEQRKVSKVIAKRKAWRKYGAASNDGAGPNPANTIIAEDSFMQFTGTKEEEDPTVDTKSKELKNVRVTCRTCKGDHWTTKCPYKDSIVPIELENDKKPGQEAAKQEVPPVRTGKYVPPSMRAGAERGKGESMKDSRRDEQATIRVTNLSEDTRESDVQELFRNFGTISRIYLAKDKQTQMSKGFAFITFHRREDAARAIAGVSGFGYDHLILNVEWAKPSTQ
ncbi:PREDICTED: eukaryotic translation initiation factor 3 subunit G-like [Priapulus caudatus]|uniref:Eukaryotic translation initiation factor 3 subunit G n=1 Tax=Priapulus caudatus TaxID=37621 RepID=A0ABM1FA73_PRICU|nr:PREDICTED: eukaryotic translation initiation factor 3 subunit G-like [Priapulus caudatus]